MKEIDEDDYYALRSQKQRKAMKLVLKRLKQGRADKGRLVELINQEVYDQRQDCKTFLKNLVRSENHAVESSGKRAVILGNTHSVGVKN